MAANGVETIVIEATTNDSTTSRICKVKRRVIQKYRPGFEPKEIQMELPNEPTRVSESMTATPGEIVDEQLAEGRAIKGKDEEKEFRALRLNKLREIPIETKVSRIKKRFGI